MKNQLSQFKQETAERLARQIDKEVSDAVGRRMKSECLVPKQSLIEVQKEKIRVQSELEAAKVEKSESASALQLLRHLQERVNLLKDENTQLRVTLVRKIVFTVCYLEYITEKLSQLLFRMRRR